MTFRHLLFCLRQHPLYLAFSKAHTKKLNEPHPLLVRYAPWIRHGFASLLVSYRLP